MATCDLPASAIEHPSAAALHQLKALLQGDPAFAQALHATASTEAAAQARERRLGCVGPIATHASMGG